MRIKKPPRNILELPLEKRAEMALMAGVRRAIIEHAPAGRPLYIWRDGKVVKISARELRRRYRRAGSR